MLTDVNVSILELANFVENMDKKGVASVCKFLKLPTKGLEFLELYQLKEMVFERLNTTLSENITTLRFINDVPLGIPNKNAKLETLESKFEFLIDEFEVNISDKKISKFYFNKILDEEIEFLPSDSFKIGFDCTIDLLSNSITFQTSLLRLNCLNSSIVSDIHFVNGNFNISKFDQTYALATSKDGIYYIKNGLKNKIINLTERNTNAQDIITVKRLYDKLGINTTRHSETDLLTHIENCTSELKNLYEPPDNSQYQIDMKTLNYFPITWRTTAECQFSAYDTWNVATDAISTYRLSIESDDNLTNKDEVLLNCHKFDIELSKILWDQKNPIIAKLK